MLNRKMKMKIKIKIKHQAGFTLIELIIVIMILAILGVTAAPKFWNFQRDARISALNGLKSAIESAGALTYGKAVILGREGIATAIVPGDGKQDESAGSVAVAFGYPDKTAEGLGVAVNGIGFTAESKADWLATVAQGSGVLEIQPKGKAIIGCYLAYTPATAVLPATAVIFTDKC